MSYRSILIKLGIFLALTGVMGVMIVSTLGGANVGTTDTYHADFADATGLRAGNPVKVSGVQVGDVTSVTLVDATHVKVDFTANRDQTLTSSSFAVVRYANLLGQRFLSLVNEGAPGTPLRPGSTFSESRTRGALSLTSLFNGFEPLFQVLNPTQINQFSSQIIQILQGEGGNIDDLLSQVAQLTTNLGDRDQLFVGIVDSLSKLLKSVSGHDDQLGQMLDSLTTITNNLAADAPNISRSVDAIGGLTTSVNHLFAGLNDGTLNHAAVDVVALTGVLANNTTTLDKTLKAFPVVFGDLDRVSQTGSWLSAYPCNLSVAIPNQPYVTPDDIAQTIAGQFPGGASAAQLVLQIAGLLLPKGSGLTVPLTFPSGPITASPNASSPVCK
ncbi:MAG: MCE family protein [Actinomycetota bacterium]|nr:MCE family protein [Actinomycetota bacterium]